MPARLKIFLSAAGLREFETAADIPIENTKPGNAKSAIVKPSHAA